MLFPEMSYQERGYKVEIAGVEQVEGEEAYKLIVESPDSSKTTQFYGVDSGLKLKDVTVQQGPQGGESTVTNLLSDYREVNGVLIPYEMKVVGTMPMPMTMKVEEVKINSGLSDEEFKVE